MEDRTIPSLASPVRFNDKLPESVDVAVIGAGIAGVATAWFLAKAGLTVLVCEKGRVAAEQSSRNWGWVRQQGRDPAELPIMMESIRLWDGLAAETGEDLGFRREGCLYLADTEDQLEQKRAWIETARQHQLDSRIIGRAEVDKLVAGARGQWVGGLYTPGDARAEPILAVPAMARAAQRLGVAVRENCAVRTLERSGGRVSAVLTEAGRVSCQAAVLAAGAWSSLFLRNLGIDLPQLTVRSSAARTAKAQEIFAGNASAPGLAFRRRQDGGYTVALGDYSEHYLAPESFRYFKMFMPLLKSSAKEVKLRFEGSAGRFAGKRRWGAEEESPFERQRVLDVKAAPEAVKRLRQRIDKRLPALAGVPLVESWAGMIDATPDAVPVMDEAPGFAGLFLATGFSGHGFGLGPGAGRVMADLVQGKPVGHDIARFRYARFFDGSPVTLGPM